MSRWVTVMTFVLPYESYVARSLLEAEGILVFVQDEILSHVHNFYSQAVGGVKLQVPDDRVEEAVEILKAGGFVQN